MGRNQPSTPLLPQGMPHPLPSFSGGSGSGEVQRNFGHLACYPSGWWARRSSLSDCQLSIPSGWTHSSVAAREALPPLKADPKPPRPPSEPWHQPLLSCSSFTLWLPVHLQVAAARASGTAAASAVPADGFSQARISLPAALLSLEHIQPSTCSPAATRHISLRRTPTMSRETTGGRGPGPQSPWSVGSSS